MFEKWTMFDAFEIFGVYTEPTNTDDTLSIKQRLVNW